MDGKLAEIAWGNFRPIENFGMLELEVPLAHS